MRSLRNFWRYAWVATAWVVFIFSLFYVGLLVHNGNVHRWQQWNHDRALAFIAPEEVRNKEALKAVEKLKLLLAAEENSSQEELEKRLDALLYLDRHTSWGEEEFTGEKFKDLDPDTKMRKVVIKGLLGTLTLEDIPPVPGQVKPVMLWPWLFIGWVLAAIFGYSAYTLRFNPSENGSFRDIFGLDTVPAGLVVYSLFLPGVIVWMVIWVSCVFAPHLIIRLSRQLKSHQRIEAAQEVEAKDEIQQQEQQEPWYLLEGVWPELERKLQKAGVSVVNMSIGQPRPVTGIAFAGSDLQKVMKLIGCRGDQFERRPTNKENFILLENPDWTLQAITHKLESQRRASRIAYFEWCRSRAKSDLNAVEFQLSKGEEALAEIKQQGLLLERQQLEIHKEQEKLERERTIYKALLNKTRNRQALIEEFERLWQMKKVLGVALERNKLLIYTHPLKHVYKGLIGPVLIMISQTDISFGSVTGKPLNHPHISSSGRACLGNISFEVGKLIRQRRIVEAVQLLVRYLEQG